LRCRLAPVNGDLASRRRYSRGFEIACGGIARTAAAKPNACHVKSSLLGRDDLGYWRFVRRIVPVLQTGNCWGRTYLGLQPNDT
jgi:hypothetical protein